MFGENFARQLELLPDTLSAHLWLSFVALLLGTAISLPLAVLAVREARLRSAVLGSVSVIQTIPGLALLALMVPTLAGLNVLLGSEIPVLGFVPAAAALTLYSMLPIVRNTVTGITGVDEALVEAARGIGMSEKQVLWQVQLPLAAPVILAGVRTATVWVVGMATLATPVGQTSLGDYIFSGLQTRNWLAVGFGCVAAAGLALVLDGLLGLMESAARHRSKNRAVAAAVGLCLVGASAAVPSLDGGSDDAVVVIGAKPFTEQYVLAALMEQRLEAVGIQAEVRRNLGSTIAFDALSAGEIDVYVDYSGTIWSTLMKRTDPAGGDVVLSQMTPWLRERGVVNAGALGFENAYCLAMRRDRAPVRRLDRLDARALSVGGDYEFFQRPEWAALRKAYDLRFEREVTFDPSFLYEAVSRGEVDVISAYTSDGRIVAYDLVALDDPREVLPPYDAVLLLSSGAAQRADVMAALQPLVGAISVEKMRAANAAVDRDGATPEQAARTLTSTP